MQIMITRRDLVVGIVSITLALGAVAFAQSGSRPLMRSSVFQWAAMKVSPTKAGERRAVFDSQTKTLERFTCHITTLDPGAIPHEGHKHPEEEMMIVREGTVEVVQNGVTNVVEAGGIIFCASNEMHGLRNAGTNRATYFVLKWTPYDLKQRAAE